MRSTHLVTCPLCEARCVAPGLITPFKYTLTEATKVLIRLILILWVIIRFTRSFVNFEQPFHFSALRVAVALQSGHHTSYNWACHFYHHIIYAIILELTSSLFTIMTSSHEHPFPIETSWVCECEMAVGWIASWSSLSKVEHNWS